ncbi:GTP cyclohydrolase II RibA [Nocardia brasiliensis]|uniref:GTP cyclohydrolase II RibA n=1 Tax=Nocardia brasiliensis TaxID=37326 RepID=UPI002457F0C1|nr:GTP cyclohydrolase II RibA [Nocardia brasiliensis]
MNSLSGVISQRSHVALLPQTSVRTRVPVVLARGVKCAADLVTFDYLVDNLEHLALVIPPRHNPSNIPLVRVHSECLTGDVFGCDRCDCGTQLSHSLSLIGMRGGAVLYLRQEGRSIGLYNKLAAYVIQDAGYDTYQANRLLGRGADERDYRAAAQMLFALGMPRIELITDNPDKVRQLRSAGVDIVTVVPSAHVGSVAPGSRSTATSGRERFHADGEGFD